MNSAVPRHSAASGSYASGSIVPLAIVICCAVIGLDQVLHTTPAAMSASPLAQAVHWAGDVVLAVPFVAVALWAGGWLGGRLGISMTGASGVFAQASLITLVLAVLLVPAWFGHYAVDSLAPSPAVPAAAAHAAHAGHDHGGPVPPPAASWVGGGVLYLLMSVPLAAAAASVGLRVARKTAVRLAGESDVIVRVAVSVGAIALGLVVGLFLQGVANQANGLLTYGHGLIVVHAHHGTHAHLATITDVVVQPPFRYQLASAAQDGLAGQAIGLPVTFAGLLWLTRRMRDGRTTRTSAQQVSD